MFQACSGGGVIRSAPTLRESQEIVGPNLICVRLYIFRSISVFACPDVSLVVTRISDIRDSLLVFNPVVDFQACILANLAVFLVAPSEVFNRVVRVGVVSARLVDAGDPNRHVLPLLDICRQLWLNIWLIQLVAIIQQ